MQLIYCSSCGSSNDKYFHTCENCGIVLLKPNSEIQLLKNDLFLIKKEYESKISALLDKIEKIEKASYINTSKESHPSTEVGEEVIDPVVGEVVEEVVEVAVPKVDELSVVDDSLSIVQEITPPVDHPISTDERIENQVVAKEEETATIEVKDIIPLHKVKEDVSSVINKKSLRDVLKSIPLLSFILEELGGPILNLWAFFSSVYTKYKEKKQLPVFFMTIAGMGALLFGFGYLMQLSIGYFGELSALVKIVFGFACSSGIAFWATRLYKKGEKYHEFSSALIGLSVSLNYLFVYFLSSITGSDSLFSSSDTGFVLIVLNTVFAILFSLRYQTKVVAVLSLIGGAFAPFYLNADGSSIMYFAYLWLLSASSIYVARKIKWQTLGVISFVTATSIIELAVYNSINLYSNWEYLTLFHAFAYLFLWFSFFEGKRMSDSLTKSAVIMIAGNVSVFLFNLYYLFDNTQHYTVLGIVYIINALAFFPVLWMFKKSRSKQMKLLILVIAGTFAAFALPAIFDKHLLGFFWSVEALGLVFLGYTFSMPSVRKEGYILLAIAFVKMFMTFNNLWFIVDSELITSGYFNLLTVGFVLGVFIFLLEKYKSNNLPFENKLSIYIKNAGSVWFMVIYILTALFYTYNLVGYAVVIAALLVIVVGYKFKLRFSVKLGYGVFVACMVFSAIHSIYFIPLSWHKTIYTSGFANLVGIGVYLFLLQGLYLGLNKYSLSESGKDVKENLSKVSEMIAVWFIIALIVFVAYYSVAMLAFFTVLCGYGYMIWGRIQSVKIKNLGYFIYGLSIIYAVLWAVYGIKSEWDVTLFSAGYVNLVGIGIFFGSMMLMQNYLVKEKMELDNQMLDLVTNLWPVWFTGLFLVSGFYSIGNYTYNLAIIPMFGFIFWGHKKKLEYTEYIGLAYSFILVFGVMVSANESQSYRFSLQSISGKVAMVELLFCLWFLKVFYDKLLKGTSKAKAMNIVREIFYWIVPLLIISPVRHHLPEYLSVALWLGVLANFFIYEKTKRKSLIIEFMILAMIATFTTLFAEVYYLSIPVSLLVLGILFVTKKGFNKLICFNSDYTPVFISAVYYVGACLFVVMLHLLNDYFYAFFVTGIYFTLVVLYRENITPLKRNFVIAFWISLISSIIGLVLSYNDVVVLNHLLILGSIALLGALLYSQQSVYLHLQKTRWLYLVILIHVLFLIGYSGLLNDTALTIVLILHAILLLFNSMKRFYKPLVWQSVAFFGIAVVKLTFWDMAHFTMLQKVIVFVIIGGLLIGASFLYMKLKERFEEQEEAEI